VICNLLSIW